MTTTKIIPALLFVAIAGCTSFQKEAASSITKEPAFVAVVTHKNLTDSAWGYIVEVNGQQLIQQFNIPGIEGNQPFINEQQAALVGNLVAQKLNNGKHPSISKKELDSLGITQLQHATEKK